MDGYSFTTNPLATDATARIVEKLAAAKSEGQLLVFEGNPLSLAAADRPKVDFIALDTEKLENVQEVKLQVLNATGYAGIAPEKLLLAAEISAPLLMRSHGSSRPSMRCRAASSNSGPSGRSGSLTTISGNIYYHGGDRTYQTSPVGHSK